MKKKKHESDLQSELEVLTIKKDKLLKHINENNIISLPISENKFYHDIIKIN